MPIPDEVVDLVSLEMQLAEAIAPMSCPGLDVQEAAELMMDIIMRSRAVKHYHTVIYRRLINMETLDKLDRDGKEE